MCKNENADPTDADAVSEALFEGALRAAFGPDSTAQYPRHSGILDVLRRSKGASSRILLRDEPGGSPPIIKPPSTDSVVERHERGRYQVLGEIGRGGMGIVLKGRDPDLGRDVALKVLRSENVDNPAMIQRFLEEAQIGGQLQHPGILPVYEFGVDSGLRPYFTMRLVQGQDLVHDA